jgi:hypothetical protein
LIGDADGGHLAGVDPRGELAQHDLHRLPDVVGVVLDPARLREVLRELAVRRVDQAAVLVEGDGPHPRGAGVDGYYECHGGADYRSNRSRSDEAVASPTLEEDACE